MKTTMVKILKSKIFYLIIAAVIGLSASILTTYSWYIDYLGKDNIITIGDVDIEVKEDFPPVPPIIPGAACEFNKKPWVKNNGNAPVYVRIRADLADGRLADHVSFDINESKWGTRQADGYYYYYRPLDGGEETEALFTTVSILDTAPASALSIFNIYIYAEGVQTAGYSSAADAWAAYVPGE